MFLLCSKHRNAIMGFSALLIVVHHYFTAVLNKPYKFGAIGVDFFMFVMGIGLYFSLYNSQNSREDKSLIKVLPSFYYRRFKKILPVLFVFLVFWGMWKHTNGGFELKEFLLNLSFVGYWTLPYGKYFNWFISSLPFFYILAPFVYFLMNKSKNKILTFLLMFAFTSFLVFVMRKEESGEIHRTLIMVVRIIPFLFGMLFGAYCKETPSSKEKQVAVVAISLLFALGVFLYYKNNSLWNDSGFTYGLPWYALGLMTPLICAIMACLLEWCLNKSKHLNSFLNFFGIMSFELYLTHIFVIEYIMPPLKATDNLWFAEPLNFISCVFVSALFAYVLLLFKNKASLVIDKCFKKF